MDTMERDELINGNTGLVWDLAKSIGRPATVDIEDLVQEGLMAMVEAVENFDPTLGYRFSTYGGTAAYRRMVRYTKKNMPARAAAPPESFDREVASLSTAESNLDIVYTDDDNVDALVDVSEIIRIGRKLELIDKRDEFILRRRAAGDTLRQLGDRLGIHRERVRQLEKRSIERLHGAINDET